MAVLLVTAAAQLLALGLQIIFARLLGPAEYGIFSYVAAALAVGLILAKLGLDTALVRLVAEFLAAGKVGAARSAVTFARLAVLVASVILTVGGFAWSRFVVEEPSLRAAMVVAACLLPLAALSEITAAALRGLRRLAVALSGDGLVRPLVAIAGILLAAGLSTDLAASSALLAYLLGTLASLAVTTRLLRSSLPAGGEVVETANPRSVLAVSIPLMMASGILVAIYSVDTLMLGSLADTTTAGYYAVASRIALFVIFFMNVAQTVASPLIAATRVNGRTEELRAVVRVVNGLALLAAIPATILFVGAAEPLLGIFGGDFQAAAPALRILVISQFLNVLTGPTGTVLSMTGHERMLAILLALGLIANIALNIAWIPSYGLLGAAWASLVAQLVWNLVAALVIWRKMAFDVTSFDLLRRVTVTNP